MNGAMPNGFNMNPNMMNNYYNTPPATSGGPRGGTSILAIKRAQQEAQQMGMAPQNMQGQAHFTHPGYSQQYQGQQHDAASYHSENTGADTGSYQISQHLKSVVDDITSDINDDKRNKRRSDTETEEETEEEVEENSSGEADRDKKEVIPMKKRVVNFVKEPLLLWAIFMVLSQDFVKKLIGNYIESIVPDRDTGAVGFAGIAAYGLVLVISFVILKYLFI